MSFLKIIIINNLNNNNNIFYFLFSWKVWAASRFIFFWGQFLKHPNAMQDPQYDTIKKTYDAVSKKK